MIDINFSKKLLVFGSWGSSFLECYECFVIILFFEQVEGDAVFGYLGQQFVGIL